jgi:signal transduction histidine kinase
MKISIFRTMWFRILLYCIGIIILTVAIIYIIHITVIQKEIDKDRMHDRLRHSAHFMDRIQKMLDESGSLEETFNQMNSMPGPDGEKRRPDFLYIADLNGTILGNEREHGMFDAPRLTRGDLERLKSGAVVDGSYRDRRRNRRLNFLAHPLYIKGIVAGGLIGIEPPPPPGLENMVRMSILQAILIALGVSSAAALLFARSLTRPLRQIEAAARRVAGGDFSGKMNLKRHDELGLLADSFDDMTGKLEAHIRSRARMMADISHELSTPLTTIHGTAEALLDGIIEGDHEKARHLRNILKQVQQLSFLIDDVTELSKFETGDIKIEKEPFAASGPILTAMDSAKIIAMKKDITISSPPADEVVKVIGDPRRIVQALQNLINNGIVHNPPGTEIQVFHKREGEKVLFAVEDNGKEIPPEEFEHIFERFYKVEKSRADTAPGAGLGLAIVKEILLAHDSTISVSVSKGKKRFFFYLPAAEDRSKEEKTEATPHSATQGGANRT